MYRSVRVPVRVRPSPGERRVASEGAPEVAEAVPPVTDREAVSWAGPSRESGRYEPRSEVRVRDPNPNARGAEGSAQRVEEDDESLGKWRDRALRLQAEMEGFRKRQQRLAEERVAADRERLLRAFLGVADDLERALGADGTDTESLRRGVDLTYQGLMRLMEREGAELIQAEGQPFDPAFHEAVGTMPHEQVDAGPDMVVEVVQTGYQLEDRLLRPARVIVAT
jgi:molecular chaperone GrpE